MIGAKPVAISSLAKQIDRFEAVHPETKYTLLGMRSRIGGPFIRETKLGSDVSAAKFNQVRAGDFIYSRLFAWQGSFGIVPKEMDGCFVSNEFPIYELDRSIVEPAFLLYWFGLPEVQKRVEADCSSSTPGTRNRFKEQYFSALEIRLPTLDNQRNIVARINALRSKIDDACELHSGIQADIDALLVSMAHRNDLRNAEKEAQGWQHVALGEVLTQVFDPVDVQPDQEYPNLGIYSYARGLFRKAPIEGANTSAAKLYRVRSGQFIYSRLFAFEGAYGRVPPDFDGSFVSNEYPTFECNPNRVKTAFLESYFRSPAVWEDIAGFAVGLGSRRKRVKPDSILAHKLWLPPLSWQERIEVAADRFTEISPQRKQSITELQALLPSILDRAFKGEL